MNNVKYRPRGNIYNIEQIDDFINESVNISMLTGNNKKVYYYNVPAAFDIETSSFYVRDNKQYTYDEIVNYSLKERKKFEKRAIMYMWQFGLNGNVITGRTWNEYQRLIKALTTILGLNQERVLIVYVHNLSYEFQFICKWFKWDKVFNLKERTPVYAQSQGIEYRCSLILSGYSLQKVGEHLNKYHIKKLTGNLDYRLIRHSKTPLTPDEIAYCINDVLVVMAYIREYIEQVHTITRIPLTKTGAVRRYMRKNCMFYKDGPKQKRNFRYLDLIASLKINDITEFKTLLAAFQGGFTHANAAHTCKELYNVSSYDFTSSYPSVMVSELFPMSRGVRVQPRTIKELEYYCNTYCSIFHIRINGLMCKISADTPLSSSKCRDVVGIIENNGRVYAAKTVTTCITNIDYKILKTFYSWQSIEVGGMYVYRRGYLPREIFQTVLTLYKDKTELKGVEGKEIEYLHSKELLNSCYGMIVTNPIRDNITYDNVNGWTITPPNNSEELEMLFKYNTSKNRFLFYPWGVFVTAYARRNLFTAIYAIKDDYVYSDTDSVKILNAHKYSHYFKTYNELITKKITTALQYHGLNTELAAPTTIKGVQKPLGVWDYEGTYSTFKTLGAKRYMTGTTHLDGRTSYSLTVSGLNKKTATPYLTSKYDNPLDAFTDSLHIPHAATGKQLHTYIDYEIKGVVMDYMGTTFQYHEKSAIHLEPTDFTLNLSLLYIDFLKGRKLL